MHTQHASEADPLEIALHYAGLKNVPLHHLKFVDEVSISRKNGCANYGRAPIGERCIAVQPFVRGQTLTCVGIAGQRGMLAHRNQVGAMNGDDYTAFILELGTRVLVAGDYLITDNCAIHKGQFYQLVLLYLGVTVWFLPGYFPKGNMIEYIWRNGKSKMRALGLLARLDPARAWDICMAEMYDSDMTALINLSGYY